VLHSIAATLEHLRAHPGNRVLVTGIGMANAKHAATVLSSAAHIPPGATGEVSYRDPLDIEPVTVVPAPTGEATIVTYTIDHDREGTPSDVILILDLVDGGRTIANAADPVADARRTDRAPRARPSR
jgi:pyrimidine operon attenuation protein/uracil phosphoribosyltransferase